MMMPDAAPRDFAYVPDALLPALVLVLRTRPSAVMQPSLAWNWQYWRHQTAGYACNQLELICLPLDPQPVVAEAMQQLAETYYESQLGIYGHNSLDEVLAYREWVRTHLPADCTWQWMQLQEGYYPLDCPDTAAAQALTTTALPDDLDDLLEFDSPWGHMMGMLNRWELAILAENCD